MYISLGGYRLCFSLLTTKNRYEPADLVVSETTGGLVASTTTFSYGDGSGSTVGLFRVILQRRDRGISWQASAEHPEPIKGIMATVGPLPLGRVMIPPSTEVDRWEDGKGRCFVYPRGYYPRRDGSTTSVEPRSGPLPDWGAQFALFQGGSGFRYLHAHEYPPRVKKLWLYPSGDSLELVLYSEADACRRGGDYSAPSWHLDEVGDWRQAVEEYRGWMAGVFGLRPVAERADAQPWLKDMSLVVVLHGLSHYSTICHDYAAMGRRLQELATLHPPQRTLVKLLGHEGPIDRRWPDNEPAALLGGAVGFQRFMSAAHRLGYRVMPHLNVWGASYENPVTADLLAYQVRDGEGRPVSWSCDYDHDEVAEEIMAYISPDAPEWRALLGGKIRGLVDAYRIDAIFLDQVGTFVNDSRYDHFRGLQTLYRELRAAMPAVQFTGEGPNTEISTSLCPLLSGVTGASGEAGAEMYRRLLGPYVLEHGHCGSLAPEPYRGVWVALRDGWWSPERYTQQEERAARMGAIPTLNLTDQRISLEGERVRGVLARAQAWEGEAGTKA
jgi:hypothetical protein